MRKYLSDMLPGDAWIPPVGGVIGTSSGTEELGHMEMVSAIVYQLTQNLCVDEIKKQGFADYFVDQSTGI